MPTEEEIIEHVKILSYQDKIKLINKIVPLRDFNNQKYAIIKINCTGNNRIVYCFMF